MGCHDEHRQNDEHERAQKQECGRGPAPEPVADQSLTHRPSRGCECRAKQNRGRERLHDRQDADEEADNEQHENAALDQGHPRGNVGRSFVHRSTEFICHGWPSCADWRFAQFTTSTRAQLRSGSNSFVAAAIAAVCGPRSFWKPMPSWLTMKVKIPEAP